MGFFSAISRILKAMLVGALMLPRIDDSVLPGGFQRFDQGKFLSPQPHPQRKHEEKIPNTISYAAEVNCKSCHKHFGPSLCLLTSSQRG